MKQGAITVRLEHDLEPLLDEVCRRSGRTRSDVVREALRRYLAQLRFEQLRRRVMQHVLLVSRRCKTVPRIAVLKTRPTPTWRQSEPKGR
jgi:metal-responsive CopG/Arc/MetJ family transcriptional regulator